MSHDLEIAERNVKAFVAVRRFRVECACGFRGEWRRSRDDADSDGFAHLASITPEAPRAA